MPIELPDIESPTPSGEYADRSDIEAQFGVENVRIWSRMDENEGDADDARIASALAYADAVIGGYFPSGITLSPIVTRWAAVYAGLWLYRSRPGGNAAEWSDLMREIEGEINAALMPTASPFVNGA